MRQALAIAGIVICMCLSMAGEWWAVNMSVDSDSDIASICWIAVALAAVLIPAWAAASLALYGWPI